MRFTLQTHPNSLPRSRDMEKELGDGDGFDIETRRPQILVDISILYRDQKSTGIQRVVRKLWQQLSHHLKEEVELRPVFATRSHGYGYAPPDFLDHRADESRLPWLPIVMRRGDIFLGLDFCPSLLPRYEKDIQRWKAAGALIYLFVYDLLPLQNWRWFNAKTRWNYRRWIRLLERQCDHAICISDTVAQELRLWLSERGRQKAGAHRAVSKIRLGADFSELGAGDPVPAHMAALLNQIAPMRAALMVGTLEPRKGYDKILAAFDRLWADSADRHCFIIVGKSGWKTRCLQVKLRSHREAGRRLFWIEDASDADLNLLYRRCDGFLFASYGEGYGLPVVEALEHGCKVMARDLPVLREVADQRDVTFFQDDRADALATEIDRWLDMEAAPVAPRTMHSWNDAGADLRRLLYRGIPSLHSHEATA